jgi:hypothetical protein
MITNLRTVIVLPAFSLTKYIPGSISAVAMFISYIPGASFVLTRQSVILPTELIISIVTGTGLVPEVGTEYMTLPELFDGFGITVKAGEVDGSLLIPVFV